MTLRLIGAGLPRTATWSLKTALEVLLTGPCYHMRTLFARPDHVAYWSGAVAGGPPDWQRVYDGYAAAVDWPTSAFVEQVAEAFPDAVVVLSVRADAATWWQSIDRTILPVFRRDARAIGRRDLDDAWLAMVTALLEREFGPDWGEATAAMAAYERHIERIRSAFDPERLVIWRAEQGWAPICRALGIAVPNEPFPRLNSSEQWLGRYAAPPS